MSTVDWNEASVLVTGGTGSFGQMFVEIMVQEYHPRRLIIFSRDELKQNEMRQRWDYPSAPVRYFLGDVRDRDRLQRALSGVDVLVHAAALKQVPALEYNPFEAVLTNIIGTKNVIDAALDSGVEHVIGISTDKAVNPINLYGATKLVAEKLLIQGNAYVGGRTTHLSCARYGNVLGSRGSVIPLFREQRNTGKITMTDKRMTRFWITLEQGVRFVIRCVEQMRGGEIFVPKIPSMSIVDLAKALAPDCEVEYTGIRAGEKIHEVLVSQEEAPHTVELDDMYVIQPKHPWLEVESWPGGKPLLDGFRYTSDTNAQGLSIQELRNLSKWTR